MFASHRAPGDVDVARARVVLRRAGRRVGERLDAGVDRERRLERRSPFHEYRRLVREAARVSPPPVNVNLPSTRAPTALSAACWDVSTYTLLLRSKATWASVTCANGCGAVVRDAGSVSTPPIAKVVQLVPPLFENRTNAWIGVGGLFARLEPRPDRHHLIGIQRVDRDRRAALVARLPVERGRHIHLAEHRGLRQRQQGPRLQPVQGQPPRGAPCGVVRVAGRRDVRDRDRSALAGTWGAAGRMDDLTEGRFIRWMGFARPPAAGPGNLRGTWKD